MASSHFDPSLWLRSFTEIGGGYALMSGRRLFFSVDRCDTIALTDMMAQIVGQPDRQEAVKGAIERRQHGEAQQ